jgi:hypothetical protein
MGAQRAVRVVVSFMAAGLLAAAACNAEGEGESVAVDAAQLIYPGVNNNVCNAGNTAPEACGSGEVPHCSTVCVTPVASGQACTPNSCGSDSVCDPPFASSCMWTGSSYRCKTPSDSPAGLVLWGGCSASSTTAYCPADTWCKNAVSCGGAAIGGNSEICVTYKMQEDLCDSSCAKCAANTTCHSENTGYSGVSGRCRKWCYSNDDCPCEDDGALLYICSGASPSEPGLCYHCNDSSEACNDQYKCCSSDDECGPFHKCCHKDGEACSTPDDCCRPDSTCISGSCAPCLNRGVPCTADSDCCGPSWCDTTSHTCQADCTMSEGKPCTVPDALGECAKGTWQCQSNESVCVPNTASTVESCDGKDNNCDGAIDNEEWPSCATEQHPAYCQSGFTVTTAQKCVKTGPNTWALQCGQPKEQVDFCIGAGVLANNDSCGLPAATPCTADSECPPNYWCNQSLSPHVCVPTANCQASPSAPGSYSPKCWLPASVGTTCCSDANHLCQ